jgi:hypothetical protein
MVGGQNEKKIQTNFFIHGLRNKIQRTEIKVGFGLNIAGSGRDHFFGPGFS